MVYRNYIILLIVIFIISGCAGKVLFLTSRSRHLTDRIEAIISPVGAEAVWSICILNYTEDRIIFEKNAALNLIPASNIKLFTTSAALYYLKPDFYFETRLLSSGSKDTAGVFCGDLFLVGGGDPTISSEYFDSLEVFQQWADIIRRKGIMSIRGEIFPVDTLFKAPLLEPTCEWGDTRYYYAAPANPLCFNDNCWEININSSKALDKLEISHLPDLDLEIIDRINKEVVSDCSRINWEWIFPDSALLLTGSISADEEVTLKIPFHNTAKLFSQVFLIRLKDCGISYYDAGESCVHPTPESTVVETYDKLDTLLIHQSPELSCIIKVINTQSVNLYAEQLLRILGFKVSGEGSTSAGIKVIYSMLDSISVAPTVHLVDGSGLSRHSWASAYAIASLLKYCLKSDFAPEFINSLAQYGEGTLENRALQDMNEVQVRAKTGSMDGVRALSGYVFSKDETYIFSIICNNFTCSPLTVENAIDHIINQICPR